MVNNIGCLIYKDKIYVAKYFGIAIRSIFDGKGKNINLYHQNQDAILTINFGYKDRFYIHRYYCIDIWDLENKRKIRSLDRPKRISKLAFTKDKNFFTVEGEGDLIYWDKHNRIIKKFDFNPQRICIFSVFNNSSFTSAFDGEYWLGDETNPKKIRFHEKGFYWLYYHDHYRTKEGRFVFIDRRKKNFVIY